MVVKITNSNTIEICLANGPRTLQTHVGHAIEWSENGHLENIQVVQRSPS